MTMMMNTKLKVGLGVGILLLIALMYACQRGKTPHDLQEYIQQLKQTENAKKHVYLTKDIELPKPVTYTADTLREPFSQIGSAASTTSKTSFTSPLEAYPLNLLQFVGTVTLNHATYAYIQSPDNMLHQVQKGSLIGDHHGKVISIQRDKLNIMETETDGDKPAIQRVVSLQLKEAHQ